MFLVRTKMGPSKIHGYGVFAVDFIPNSTVVWKFQPGFDVELTMDDAKKLPQHTQQWLEHYGYLDRNLKRWIICVDDARFVNHSEESNMKSDYSVDSYGPDVACKDIHPGDEITVDYRLFEDREPPG